MYSPKRGFEPIPLHVGRSLREAFGRGTRRPSVRESAEERSEMNDQVVWSLVLPGQVQGFFPPPHLNERKKKIYVHPFMVKKRK